MALFATITGVILPPITLLTFMTAMTYRVVVWNRLPLPALTLFPSPSGSGVIGVVVEALFFPTLFCGNRALWFLSWTFHALLLAIIAAHIQAVLDLSALWSALGVNDAAVSLFVGRASGVMILVAVVGLLGRRVALRRVREISTLADYFSLLLILAVVVTGNVVRFQGQLDVAVVRDYFRDLATFHFATPPMNGWFLLHLLLAQLLILYMPFSKMLHFGGVFFTHRALRRC